MRRFLPALTAALLQSCASTAPYRASAGDGSLGYAEQHIEGARWYLSFESTTSAPKNLVHKQVQRRAGEICGGAYVELEPELSSEKFPFVVRSCDSHHNRCETDLYQTWIECP